MVLNNWNEYPSFKKCHYDWMGFLKSYTFGYLLEYFIRYFAVHEKFNINGVSISNIMITITMTMIGGTASDTGVIGSTNLIK